MAMPESTVLYRALSTVFIYAASFVMSAILFPNMASPIEAQLSE